MSSGAFCICKPVDRAVWRVMHRNHNHSYFEYPKGGEHYSQYSTVRCTKCHSVWHTKAAYVLSLKDED